MSEWDVLMAADAAGHDAELMAQGHHYDYETQRWMDGHDHAHCRGDKGPLLFCGADWPSCGVYDLQLFADALPV